MTTGARGRSSTVIFALPPVVILRRCAHRQLWPRARKAPDRWTAQSFDRLPVEQMDGAVGIARLRVPSRKIGPVSLDRDGPPEKRSQSRYQPWIVGPQPFRPVEREEQGVGVIQSADSIGAAFQCLCREG